MTNVNAIRVLFWYSIAQHYEYSCMNLAIVCDWIFNVPSYIAPLQAKIIQNTSWRKTKTCNLGTPPIFFDPSFPRETNTTYSLNRSTRDLLCDDGRIIFGHCSLLNEGSPLLFPAWTITMSIMRLGRDDGEMHRIAALYVSNRAASIWTAASACRNCIPWNSPTGLPNCLHWNV